MKKVKLLVLLAIPFLGACDLKDAESGVNSLIDNFESFDINSYDANAAIEMLDEIGHTEYGYEISLLSRYSQSSIAIINDDIVQEEVNSNTRYTIGQQNDLRWGYADVEVDGVSSRYGVAYDGEEDLYSYFEGSWHLVTKDDVSRVVDYFSEGLEKMLLPGNYFTDLVMYGYGPENVTVAGRRCSKYTVSADASHFSASSFFTFDCETSLLLAFSATETSSTDVSSMTTTVSLNVTGFSIMPVVPNLANAK